MTNKKADERARDITTLITKGQAVPANSKAWFAPLHLVFRKEKVGSKNKHLSKKMCYDFSGLKGTVLVALAVVVITVSVGTQQVFAQQQSNMTRYTDPQGRFSIVYPFDWTVSPATNRFSPLVVQFVAVTGTNVGVVIVKDNLSTVTDPSTFASAMIAGVHSYGFLVFQNVECTKYKIDGQRACYYITTKAGDPFIGRPDVVIQLVSSYLNGKMFAITFAANRDTFDSTLPTFEKMLASFRSPS